MNKFWKVVGCLIVGSVLGNIYSYVKDTNERVRKVEKAVCPPAVKEDEEEEPEEEKAEVPKEEKEEEPKKTGIDENFQKELLTKGLDRFLDEYLKHMFPDKPDDYINFKDSKKYKVTFNGAEEEDK